jgi:hypothetical protein
MIPKKIHYCWLSKGKMPKNAKKCIKTWHKILPEYEFILWDTDRFDINSIPYVKQAYESRKWAFAADYIRLYAVYNEGGIYLDTDVYMLKSFNNLLNYNFFSSLERDLTTVPPGSDYANSIIKNENYAGNRDLKRIEGFGVQAAVFGACKGNSFLKDCMDWYEKNNYILPDGRPIESSGLVAPDIYAFIMQKYGFKYKSGFQQLDDNMVILPADHFPNHIYKTDNAYAVHLCDNSWANPGLIKRIKKNNFIRFIFGKQKHFDWEKRIKLGGDYKLND